MLTPGEMVMNTGVTQNPQLMQQLAMLNVQGAQQMQQQPVQGFSMGGRVCGYETGGQVPMNFCPHCGSPKPQGFAFGGAVGGANGVPQWAPQGAGMTPQPAQGIGNSTGGTNFFGGGGLGVQNIAGSGGWQRPPWLTPPSQQPFNYTHNAEGNTTNYNPNDPYGAFAHNLDPTAFGASQRQLGAYGNAGYFDPRGNQMLINSMNEGAQGTADALVRRNTTQADLSGLDPAQRAVAKQQALRDTGRGVQDIMANTRAQALGNANDFAQSLYNQQLQGAIGQYGQLTGARLGDWQAGNQQNRNNKNYWGDLAGGVLGAGVGGYFGRP
jgi:hypothetical protein